MAVNIEVCLQYVTVKYSYGVYIFVPELNVNANLWLYASV